jgi:hypothetical protein
VEELVQRGKGDIDLELRAGRPQQPDPGAGGDRGGLVQQGGLPTPGSPDSSSASPAPWVIRLTNWRSCWISGSRPNSSDGPVAA